MKISIVGTGYVGLVTGTCFAETGLHVTCVDVDSKKINNLKYGILPIYEPGLDVMIERNASQGRLFFTTSMEEALDGCEVLFIAVGTPPGEDGSADLTHVLSVASEIGRLMGEHLLIATKSTVPVGTSQKIRTAIQEKLDERNLDLTFDVASNPEFLKEGSAIDDFLKPDRIIIGVDSDHAKKLMSRLYKPFLLNNHPIIFMDVISAELTKYAANAMLATRISFMNDIANFCEITGADVNAVRRGIGSDPRIGNKFIYPGAGYGGSCFPKDMKALIKMGEDSQYPFRLLKAAEEINFSQKKLLFEKIHHFFRGKLDQLKIAVWGLSFKPNTDDIREAPALVLIEQLLTAGVRVAVYDPVAMKEAKQILGDNVEYVSDKHDSLNEADALVVVTEWAEFRLLNYKLLASKMKGRVVFDGRNIYEPSEMREHGFSWFGIGRKPVVL